MPSAAERFHDIVRQASAQRAPLRVRGGGSKDFYGQAVQGGLLDTRSHAGIVAYDPTELVITARCGTPLAEVESALAEKGQMLAFEPPHFTPDPDGRSLATFAGMIAAGLSGPRRAAAGAVRDYLLGVRIMDGRGRELVFGGQVMKNVAGYDVSRVMAGSLGSLALILEASVKTLPRPPAEVTLLLEMPEATAIESLNRWAGMGWCVSASAWMGGELHVRLSGASAAVRAAVQAIGGQRVDDEAARRFWTGIRDHQDGYFKGDAALWRLSVPQTAAPLGLAGGQLIEWGGGLRWLRSGAEAGTIRQAAVRAGGHATLFRGGDRSSEVFHPLSPVLAEIHRKLKAVFDPEGIFNPGRMYKAL